MVTIKLKGGEIGRTSISVFLLSEEALAKFSSPLIDKMSLTHIKQDFKAKTNEVYLCYSNLERFILVGLGKERDVTLQIVRLAIYEAVNKLRTMNLLSSTFIVPSLPMVEETSLVKAMVQSILLSDYNFDKYLTCEEKKLKHLDMVTLFKSVWAQELKEDVKKTITIVRGTLYTRDLQNERADLVTPDYLEIVAKRLATECSLPIKVLSYEELKKKGLNLLTAVGQGAASLPRLILLEYRGNPTSKTWIGLVGKGITFDSGGLNMKPTNFIENMYLDKSGVASVLGVLKVASELKLKKNIIGVLAIAENAVDAKSYKPQAILKSYKGLTVEVTNTDAEGRLVLADALSYVQDHYAITILIDIATLTGACVVALGEYASGVFSNDDTLRNDLIVSGERCFERVWPLPIFPEHTEEMKSSFADLKNSSKSRYGGACTGAAFLQQFINEGVKWAHIDASSSITSEQRAFIPMNGTGFGVHLLIEYLLRTG